MLGNTDETIRWIVSNDERPEPEVKDREAAR